MDLPFENTFLFLLAKGHQPLWCLSSTRSIRSWFNFSWIYHNVSCYPLGWVDSPTITDSVLLSSSSCSSPLAAQPGLLNLLRSSHLHWLRIAMAIFRWTNQQKGILLYSHGHFPLNKATIFYFFLFKSREIAYAHAREGLNVWHEDLDIIHGHGHFPLNKATIFYFICLNREK